MFEVASVEAYKKWCSDNPIQAAGLDWDEYTESHSELLGYFRWCEMKRKSLSQNGMKQTHATDDVKDLDPSTNELELRAEVSKIMYHVEKSLDPEAGTELVMTLIDKAKREARSDELRKLGKFWQTGVGDYKIETTHQWQHRVTHHVMDRIKQLEQEGN